MRKQRKHYTAEEKVAVLRRHLIDSEPVSKLCDELALQPTVFYRWQKEFFENGAGKQNKAEDALEKTSPSALVLAPETALGLLPSKCPPLRPVEVYLKTVLASEKSA